MNEEREIKKWRKIGLNISLLVIWFYLLGFAMYRAWDSFNNMQVIAGGEKNNYPGWMFALTVLPDLPWWWWMLFGGIITYFIYWLWSYSATY